MSKSILRTIANVSTTHSCRPLFKGLNLLTLCGIYIYELCVYVFLNKNKFITIGEKHNLNTRSQRDYYVSNYNYNIGMKSPNIMGVKVFNKLPNLIKESSNINRFKSDLKKYLIDLSIYKIDEYLKP